MSSDSILKKYPKRTLKNFQLLKKGMTVSEIEKIVGKPDKDVGSGFYVFEYAMPGNSTAFVTVSAGLLSVRYENGKGKKWGLQCL